MRILAVFLSLALVGCGGGGAADYVPLPAAQAQPVADDTESTQSALDLGCLTGSVHFAAKVYRTSATLLVKCPIDVAGEGMPATFIVSSAAEGMVVTPEAAAAKGFRLKLHGFSISSAVPGAGKAALVLRTKPGVFISRFNLSFLSLTDFGGPNLVLDNGVGNENGIFTGVIEQVWADNGIRADQVGDTVTIQDSTITASAASRASGKGWPGIEASGRSGARKLIIQRNNITAAGGCIYLHDIAGPEVVSNVCEHADGMPYAGLQDGFLQFTNVTEADVEKNSINLHGLARYAVAFSGGSQNSLISNKFGIGTQGHLAFLNGSAGNTMSGARIFRYASDPRVGTIVGAAGGLLTTP